MNHSAKQIEEYLHYCQIRKELDSKTIRAYRADLLQFVQYLENQHADLLNKEIIGTYVDSLHAQKAPRTIKRKIASLQSFYRYLTYTDQIPANPLQKIDLSFKLPQRLPRYIPTHTIKDFYQELYNQKQCAQTPYQLKCAVRNIAVIELLFSTGLRISELCTIRKEAINLSECEIHIHGKGNKERILQLTEAITLNALLEYAELFRKELEGSEYFFVNKLGHPLSSQSVRNMINHLTDSADITMHITPHMFRHSFATCLVNQDVDIRCIQELLGHSSIRTTEIYTYVDMSKQRSVLEAKNPRKLVN